MKCFRGNLCAIVTLLACAACEPCSGVGSCSSTGYLAADGQIVQTSTGQGVGGVRVDLVRRGGIAAQADSLTTTTDAGGYWHLEFTAGETGTMAADAKVTVPGGAQYWIRGISLATSSRGGDGNLVGRWVTEPYFPGYGELYLRGSESERIGGASVEFRRTGGIPFYGDRVATVPYRAISDPSGRFSMFSPEGFGAFAPAVGDVIGDLVVVRSNGDTSIARGFHVMSRASYRASIDIYRIGLGPSLTYDAQLLSRSSNLPAAGIAVSFAQTGGVSITPTSFTDISRSDGRFNFRLRALQSGRVDGRLVFVAPAPASPETVFVSLNTFDDDGGRTFGVFPVGAYFPYYGLVRANGAGLGGVKVEVQRVSGVTTQPAVDTVATGNDGRFMIALAPGAIGDVLVDLTLRPPAPFQQVTVRGVRLSAALRTVPLASIGTFDLVAGANP